MSITISSIAEKVKNLLTGETLRAINYGAIAVVYLVVKAEVALGYVQDPPNFDGIAIAVTAAIAGVTEVARRFVYSPNTVEAIIAEVAPEATVTPAEAKAVVEGDAV